MSISSKGLCLVFYCCVKERRGKNTLLHSRKLYETTAILCFIFKKLREIYALQVGFFFNIFLTFTSNHVDWLIILPPGVG